MASSWVRTITSPIKKACTFFSPHHHHHRDKKSHSHRGEEHRVMDHLEGEVMACAYEDVQVMWSILDMKSKPRNYNLTS